MLGHRLVPKAAGIFRGSRQLLQGLRLPFNGFLIEPLKASATEIPLVLDLLRPLLLPMLCSATRRGLVCFSYFELRRLLDN